MEVGASKGEEGERKGGSLQGEREASGGGEEGDGEDGEGEELVGRNEHGLRREY